MVALSGVDANKDDDGDAGSTAMKPFPPWLIMEGMDLTAEQHGKVRSNLKPSSTSASVDEKKPKDGKKEDADLKGDRNSEPSSKRRIGMKSKWEEDQADDEIKWEDSVNSGGTQETAEVAYLNLEVYATAEDEDDDDGIEWEEG